MGKSTDSVSGSAETISAPKNEHIKVTYSNNAGDVLYVLTSDKLETDYILYKLEDGKMKKLGKGKNPIQLEIKYNILDLITDRE